MLFQYYLYYDYRMIHVTANDDVGGTTTRLPNQIVAQVALSATAQADGFFRAHNVYISRRKR